MSYDYSYGNLRSIETVRDISNTTWVWEILKGKFWRSFRYAYDGETKGDKYDGVSTSNISYKGSSSIYQYPTNSGVLFVIHF